MKRKGAGELEALVNELTQGRDVTKLLKDELEIFASSELCKPSVKKIISIYDNAISILNSENVEEEINRVVGVLNSSQANEASDQKHHLRKKRNTMARCTNQVLVSSGTGRGHLDDGYSWRKYGQKAIFGAKFSRAYYRCAYRHAQGCLSMKQVQRTDDDPSIFLISYIGKHSCRATPIPITESITPKEFKYHSPSKDLLFNFETLKTEKESFLEESFPSFSFPSTPIDSGNIEIGNSLFGNFTCDMGDFGFTDQYFQNLETDVMHEIISAQTSTTNSPAGISSFSSDRMEFDPDLNFDTSIFFS